LIKAKNFVSFRINKSQRRIPIRQPCIKRKKVFISKMAQVMCCLNIEGPSSKPKIFDD